MVNRIQTLRSSVAGNVPASGTRQPGELWLNFADKQIGYIDASQVAQKVQAVRFFSTLTTYALGDCVLNAGSLYIANGAIAPGAFNASQWQLVGGPNISYLPTVGGTLTGALAVTAGGVSITGGPLSVTPANSNVTLSPTGTGTLTANPATLGHIDNVAIGQTTPAAVKTNALSASGGNIDGTVIGATVPAAATVTSMNGGPLAGMRNMIINGQGRIDQRNGNVTTTPASLGLYFGDRWAYTASVASKFNLTCGLGLGGFWNGTQTSITASVNTAYTPVAADYFQIIQTIEGSNTAQLGWGFAGAQPVTLSFGAYATIAGTYAVSIINNPGATRAYIATFTLPAAAWTTVAITIPGDTVGSWPANTTNGMLLRWNLGYGSSVLGTANAWQAISTGNSAMSVAGCVNVVATVSASLSITNVQLEAGPVATPFERRLHATEMVNCQRYYQRYTPPNLAGIRISGYVGTATQYICQTFTFPPMRATPTTSVIGSWLATNCTGASFGNPGLGSITLLGSAPAVGFVDLYSPANGGFDLSAEL